MGEVVYEFEMLDAQSPTTLEVRVAAPAGARLHPLTRTVAAGLKKRLGHDCVMFVSPCGTLTEACSDMSCPAGCYIAYAWPAGKRRAKPQLWEMLLGGAHQLVVRGRLEMAKQAYQTVVTMRRDDPDFVHSLYRHLRHSLPSMHLKHEAFAQCSHYDAIDQALGQRRAKRQARLHSWSAAAAAAATPALARENIDAISLLQLMQTLPPPYTPVDVLPLGALVRLAQTCRAWYAYVMGSQLPRLLRRALSQPTLAVGSWDFLEQLEGPREDLWTYCTFRTSDTAVTAASKPPPLVLPWATATVPAIRCPLLLRWMLTHEERTGAVASTIVADRAESVAVADMLKHLHNREPSFPDDDIRSCLRLLGLLAYGAVTCKKSVDGFPVKSDHHMICLRVATGGDGDGEEEDTEVLCDVDWGFRAYEWH